MRYLFVSLLLILTLASQPVRADMAAATEAYDQGRYHEAYQLYLIEARKGDIMAMLSLGILLEQGLGTSRDLVRAYGWYWRAEKLGDPIAAAARQALGSTLSPEQLKQAEQMGAQ